MLTSFYDSFLAELEKKQKLEEKKVDTNYVDKSLQGDKNTLKLDNMFKKTEVVYNTSFFIPTYEHKTTTDSEPVVYETLESGPKRKLRTKKTGKVDKISKPKELNIKKEKTDVYNITSETIIDKTPIMEVASSILVDLGEIPEEEKKSEKYATITLKNGKKFISQQIISEDLEFIYTPIDKINRKTIHSISYL